MTAPKAIQQLSPVMTAAEVAVYLRLIEADADADAIQSAVGTVKRLVRTGKLKALKPGREYVFALAEVERYVADETAAFEPEQCPQRARKA